MSRVHSDASHGHSVQSGGYRDPAKFEHGCENQVKEDGALQMICEQTEDFADPLFSSRSNDLQSLTQQLHGPERAFSNASDSSDYNVLIRGMVDTMFVEASQVVVTLSAGDGEGEWQGKTQEQVHEREEDVLGMKETAPLVYPRKQQTPPYETPQAYARQQTPPQVLSVAESDEQGGSEPMEQEESVVHESEPMYDIAEGDQFEAETDSFPEDTKERYFEDEQAQILQHSPASVMETPHRGSPSPRANSETGTFNRVSSPAKIDFATYGRSSSTVTAALEHVADRLVDSSQHYTLHSI